MCAYAAFILSVCMCSICTYNVCYTCTYMCYQKQFVAKGEAFDYKRLARMAAFGFLFHGTISHFFYGAVSVSTISNFFIKLYCSVHHHSMLCTVLLVPWHYQPHNGAVMLQSIPSISINSHLATTAICACG